MTTSLAFRLDLIDDVVISSDAATAGPHEGWDYVPGTAIRGAVATRLFARPVVDSDTAWVILHSGKVIFDDALPLAPGSDQVGWPLPLALHYPKDCEPAEVYAQTVNFVHGRFETAGQQAEQWRSGYITADGAHFKVQDRYVLKTGIERASGRAATGKLFGHHRIKAGQRFAASVTFEADTDPEIIRIVRECLADHLLLGRSRTAEVGRAGVTVLDEPPDVAVAAPPEDDIAVVWLLSDTALLDPLGRGTYQPTGAHFGLGAARLLTERSFVRTRRRSWFNAALGGHECEHFVLARGSVLAFADAPVRSTHFGRAGACLTHGLGRFVINPALLRTASPALCRWAAPETGIAEAPPLAEADNASLAWLRRSHATDPSQLLARIQQVTAPLAGYYRDAAALEGRTSPRGPTRSQWGAVFSAARNARTSAEVHSALFGKNGICRDRRSETPLWSALFAGPRGGLISFTDWFEAELTSLERSVDLRLAAQLFAREARMVTERLAKKKGEALRDAG